MAHIVAKKTVSASVDPPNSGYVALFFENDNILSLKDALGNVYQFIASTNIPKSDEEDLSDGDSTLSVVFATPFPTGTEYSISFSLKNTVLMGDSNVSPFTIIAQDENGFTVKFNEVDGDDYKGVWTAFPHYNP